MGKSHICSLAKKMGNKREGVIYQPEDEAYRGSQRLYGEKRGRTETPDGLSSPTHPSPGWTALQTRGSQLVLAWS